MNSDKLQPLELQQVLRLLNKEMTDLQANTILRKLTKSQKKRLEENLKKKKSELEEKLKKKRTEEEIIRQQKRNKRNQIERDGVNIPEKNGNNGEMWAARRYEAKMEAWREQHFGNLNRSLEKVRSEIRQLEEQIKQLG